MQSASLEQPRSVSDTRGKHRISAELKRLEQETRFLEEVQEKLVLKLQSENEVMPDHCPHPLLVNEELEQLEKMEKASAACKEMLMNVETRPDPLLPTTNAPLNPSWDRWFEGPQEKSGCRCWIL